MLPLSDNHAAGLTSLIVVVLFSLTAATVAVSRGIRWTCIAAAITFLFTIAIETVGTHTGFPFGAYKYSAALQPQGFGTPLIIGLAWFAMAVPAWEVARALFAARLSRVLAGAWAMAAWDLLLDPQMTRLGFWTWSNTDTVNWSGIPISNYLGWFVVSALICATLTMFDNVRGSRPPSAPLIAIYLWMCAFTSLGFMLPFVFDKPIVGIVGAAATVPLAVVALTRTTKADRTA